MFSEQLKPFSLQTLGDILSAMASFSLADKTGQPDELDDVDFPTATPKRSLFQSPESELKKKGPGTSPKASPIMKKDLPMKKASPKKKGSPMKKVIKGSPKKKAAHVFAANLNVS